MGEVRLVLLGVIDVAEDEVRLRRLRRGLDRVLEQVDRPGHVALGHVILRELDGKLDVARIERQRLLVLVAGLVGVGVLLQQAVNKMRRGVRLALGFQGELEVLGGRMVGVVVHDRHFRLAVRERRLGDRGAPAVRSRLGSGRGSGGAEANRR